jgi:hypothetical protein
MIMGEDEHRHAAAARSSLSAPRIDDSERVIWQWPLQRLGLVQRCAHPDIPLFIGGQDHGLTGNIPIL